MKSILDFCEDHGACTEGSRWAVANCSSMQDAWYKAKSDWLVWIAFQEGVLTDKELRLFACFCAKQHWDLLTDERSRKAVEVAEAFARGQVEQEKLVSAHQEAVRLSLTSLAARWAAYAARSSAEIVARNAAYWSSHWSISVAGHVAKEENIAAGDAVEKAQAAWLRANTIPNFS